MRCQNCREVIVKTGLSTRNIWNNKRATTIAIGQRFEIDHDENGLAFMRCPHCRARNHITVEYQERGGSLIFFSGYSIDQIS